MFYYLRFSLVHKFILTNLYIYLWQGVIPLEQQLEYFKEYKIRVENEIGEEKTKLLISKAMFLISAGTNDFVINYFNTHLRRHSNTLPDYQQFLLQLTQQFLKVMSLSN